MKKYICKICGFVYDEETQGEKWDDLPPNWVCPMCGASKEDFEELEEEKKEEKPKELNQLIKSEINQEDLIKLTNNELSILCSNLAKGCEKQYLVEEANLFNELVKYYDEKVKKENSIKEATMKDLLKEISNDLNVGFKIITTDRGSKRALTWSEKVTKILSSLLNRTEKDGDSFMENTNVYVCSICGFIYVGDTKPEICPICKVPSLKIIEVKRD